MPYAPGVTFQPSRGGASIAMALLNFFSQQGERKAAEQQQSEQLDMMLGGGGQGQGGDFNPAPWSGYGNEEGGASAGTVGTAGTGEGEADEQMKQAAKLSDALNTVGSLQHGIDPNRLKTMSLGQKLGLLARFNMETLAAEQAQKRMLTQSQMLESMSRGQHYQNLNTQATAAQPFFQSVNRLRQPRPLPAGYSGPPAPGMQINEAVLESAANTGYVPEASLLDALSNLDLTAEGGIRFTEDPVSRERFATRGRTTLPSGYNPQAPLQVQTIGTEGGQQATVLSTGRSAPTVLNRGTQPSMRRVLEQDDLGQPLTTWEGTPEQYRQQFGKDILSPVARPGDQVPAAPVRQRDRSTGIVWEYIGTGDPLKDRNETHWKRVK